MAKNPFAFVNALSHEKRNIVKEGEAEWRDYSAFLINRAFSYHADTVFFFQMK